MIRWPTNPRLKLELLLGLGLKVRGNMGVRVKPKFIK